MADQQSNQPGGQANSPADVSSPPATTDEASQSRSRNTTVADEKSQPPRDEASAKTREKSQSLSAVKAKSDDMHIEHDQKLKSTHSPKRTCAVLSISFFVVYTANVGLHNLQSSLNKEDGLGLISLAVLYGAMLVCAPLSPLIIRGLNAKRTLILAWLCHSLYTLSNFYPTFATLLTSSFLLGAASGPMWTAQGLYISASSMEHALSTKMGMHETLSKFNGFFFGCYELTQITGNLLSSVILSQGSYNTSLDDNVCGADYCLETDGNSTDPSEKPEQDVVYILMGIYLACNIFGFILTFVFLPVQNWRMVSSEIEVSVKESTMGCLNMMRVPRMLLLLPFFMAQSMNNGILLSGYTEAFVTCAQGIHWVGYVMTAYGALTVIQALAMNTVLARHLGRQLLLVIACMADTSTAVIMLLWSPVGSSVAIFFILPCISGIAEGICQAQLSSLIAMVFPDNITGAFAAFHTAKATGFTLTFILARFVCLRERIYVLLCLSAIGYLGYAIVEMLLVIQKKSNYTIDDNDLKLGEGKVTDKEMKVEKVGYDQSKPKEIEFTKM